MKANQGQVAIWAATPAAQVPHQNRRKGGTDERKCKVVSNLKGSGHEGRTEGDADRKPRPGRSRHGRFGQHSPQTGTETVSGTASCRPLPAITVRRGCGPDGRPDRMRPGPGRLSRREVLDARLPDCSLYNKVENKEKKAVPVGGSGWIKAERQGL